MQKGLSRNYATHSVPYHRLKRFRNACDSFLSYTDFILFRTEIRPDLDESAVEKNGNTDFLLPIII